MLYKIILVDYVKLAAKLVNVYLIIIALLVKLDTIYSILLAINVYLIAPLA